MKQAQKASQPGALSGILVLDHTTAMAGPYCAQMLGDLGADVIKIERPDGGDQARGWGPPFIGKDSAYFLGTNRNKRGITLNLASAEGREVMKKLLQKADVLIHNVPKASSRKKIGLDETYCHALNPRLIWAAISGFGNTGPYAERPGYDVIVQGMSGTMTLTGEAGSPPMRYPPPIADITTGIYTALSIVAALFARERTGKGQSIDNALFDSQVSWLANLASKYLANGEPLTKMGNAHPSVVPYQPFPTKDGWLILGVGSQRLWHKFAALIEMPQLGDDPRFATNGQRIINREALIPILTEKFCEETTESWLEKLKNAQIPSGPIHTPEAALSHEQILARGMIVELEHPLIGMIRSLGNPMNLSGTPISYRLPPPLLGEHTGEVLVELGYSDNRIQDLREKGIV